MGALITLYKLCIKKGQGLVAKNNNKAYIESDAGIDGDNNPGLSPHLKSLLLSISNV
jgi:hypothetical protein